MNKDKVDNNIISLKLKSIKILILSVNIKKINFQDIRNERQKININKVSKIIKENINDIDLLLKKLKIVCNEKALNRVLDFLDVDFIELINKINNNDISINLLSMLISKNSSRQGTKDEALVISACSNIGNKLGVNIKNLSPTAYRPLKNGKIISKKEYILHNYSKNDCLKSLDGKITGIINGWIFAKIVLGSGGHQDNVFEEAYTFAEWAKINGLKTEYYIIMIDTNLLKRFTELKNKVSESNIIICNHFEFQKWLIKEVIKKLRIKKIKI